MLLKRPVDEGCRDTADKKLSFKFSKKEIAASHVVYHAAIWSSRQLGKFFNVDLRTQLLKLIGHDLFIKQNPRRLLLDAKRPENL